MSGNEQRITIVDDDREILASHRQALELAGYEVNVCYDVYSIIESTYQNSPDLVILNAETACNDRYRAITVIRRNTTIPIIVISWIYDEASIATAFACGVDDYIIKPTDRILLARVSAKLRRARVLVS